MNKSYVLAAAALVAVIIAGGYAIYEIGMRRGSSMAAAAADAPMPQSGAAPSAPDAVPQSIAQGEGRLLELQATLSDNLRVIHETRQIEDAVHGLTGAIHLLTARSSDSRKTAA